MEETTKAQHVLGRLATTLLCVTLVVVLTMMVFFAGGMEYACKQVFLLPNWALFLVAVAVVAAVIYLSLGGRVVWWVEAHPMAVDRSVGILTLVLLILQIALCRSYAFNTGWDSGVVLGNAWQHLHGGSLDAGYFSQYPNNLFLLWMTLRCGELAMALGAIDLIGVVYVFAALNCVAVSLSLWMTYRVLVLISDRRSVALFGWVLCVLIVWTSPWAIILYSDAPVLFVPVCQVYLYVHYLRSQGRSCAAWLGLLGIVAIVGYRIKPQTLFVMLAVAIFELVRLISLARRRHLGDENAVTGWVASSLVSLSLGAALAFGATGVLIATVPVELDEDRAVGMTHFLMMGLNPETQGVYYGPDVTFSSSFPDQASRAQANWAVVGERLSNYGLVGTLSLFSNKLMTNFNDGTFAWGVEGHFFDAAGVRSASGPLSAMTRQVYYRGGVAYDLWRTYAQLVWIGVLLLCLPAVIWRRKDVGPARTVTDGHVTIGGASCKSEDKRLIAVDVMAASLLLLVVFELLFEARARYLYTYVPVFVVLAALGMARIAAWARELRSARTTPMPRRA